jgi:Ca2+-binding RTX toxin-like protein
MAVVVLGNSTIGFDATQDGDLHFLPEGRYLLSVGDAFDFLTFAGTLVVNGQIAAELDGIDANTVNSPLNVDVGATGSVIGDSDGMELVGNVLTVVNAGHIVGNGDSGVELGVALYASVTNFGTIFGADSGVDIVDSGVISIANFGQISGSSGVVLRQSAIITNTGEITGQYATNLTTVYGIEISSTAVKTIELDNSGTITGSSAAYISALNTTDVITNSGGFLGDIDLNDQNDTYEATSTGYITGFLDAGAGDDTIVGGDMADDFRGNTGNDSLDGRGGDDTLSALSGNNVMDGGAGDDSISGGTDNDTMHSGAGNDTLIGGLGNDVYHLDGPGIKLLVEKSGQGVDDVHTAQGHALGEFFENLSLLGHDDVRGVGNALDNALTGNAGANRLGGSTGNDTINGGQGDDSLYGGGGDDSLLGGEGDDYLTSGAANDTVNGDDGNDVLMGQRGSDLLNGGDGSDLIIGGSGNDTLLGGREDDTLIGGEGADQMNGAAGIDTFVWNSAGESPNSGGRDRIVSFETGLDLLDFSALGIADVNIGGAFTGGGVASIRTFESGGGDTRVFADVDGNGSTDMRIDIVGVLGVTGVDFIL